MSAGTFFRWPRPGVLAWSLWGIWLLLSCLSLYLWVRGPGDDAIGICLVGYSTVGALVASRHPRNSVGWILLGLAVVATVQTTGEVYVAQFRFAQDGVAWVAHTLSPVTILVIAVLLPLCFPDGKPPSTRWRPVMWLTALALALSLVGTALRPGPLDVSEIPNPFAGHGTAGRAFAFLEDAGTDLLIVACVLSAAGLFSRFRNATATERQQLKWFLFTVVLFVLGGVIMAVASLLPPRWSAVVDNFGWGLMFFIALFGIPVATAIAILRHRLYDIDVVINRALVYGALSISLLLTYTGTVLLLGSVVGRSPLAVALSTLAVVSLFNPVRVRIQRLVDRRFYRSRYDAAVTLDDFGARLLHEVDLDAVVDDLCSTAVETLQPRHVSLWLRR